MFEDLSANQEEPRRSGSADPGVGSGGPPDTQSQDTEDSWPASNGGEEPSAADDDLDADPGASADAELDDWREAIREDFEAWLARIDEVPDVDAEPDTAPDLYTFFEQLAAANTENRKANRRTAEAISQWGDTLARFDQSLGPLRESITQLAAVQPKTDELSRAHCLALVELLDRLQRIAKAFASTPARTGWWRGNDGAWRKAWENQRQAFEIVLSHLEGLLQKEGVTRFETVGAILDPTVMTAVAAEPDAAHPPQTVLEELAAGYRRRGELLRPAQVKVSRRP